MAGDAWWDQAERSFPATLHPPHATLPDISVVASPLADNAEMKTLPRGNLLTEIHPPCGDSAVRRTT